ncbi:MAG: hypothetical protein K1X53_03890 [Candidatus Sumerlaeaceae bacterium]|nr:hypothetical protein [Candidatus Sumerlaeaceae bacterium]
MDEEKSGAKTEAESREQVVRRWASGAVIALTCTFFLFLWIVYRQNHGTYANRVRNSQELQTMLTWGRLASLPPSTANYSIITTGNIFTRGYQSLWTATPADIEDWLARSPGTTITLCEHIYFKEFPTYNAEDERVECYEIVELEGGPTAMQVPLGRSVQWRAFSMNGSVDQDRDSTVVKALRGTGESWYPDKSLSNLRPGRRYQIDPGGGAAFAVLYLDELSSTVLIRTDWS